MAVQQSRITDVVGANQALEHGHIQVSTLAVFGLAQQGRAHQTEGVGTGQHIGGLQIGHTWRVQAGALQFHHAGERIDQMRISLRLAQGSGLAEAGDGAIHQIGLDGFEAGVIQFVFGHDAGREILDHHITLQHQVFDDVQCFGPGEIQRNAFFACVDPSEISALVGGLIVHLRDDVADLIAFARFFDFVHNRAQV